jgi:chromosome segregation ATPase
MVYLIRSTGASQERQRQLQVAGEELECLRAASIRAEESVEAGRRALLLQQQGAQVQGTLAAEHASEARRLREELRQVRRVVARQEEQLVSLQTQLGTVSAESELRAGQLKVAKCSAESLLRTIGQLERGAAADRAEREGAQRRCVEAEEGAATLTRLQSRSVELEQQLLSLRGEERASATARVAAEEGRESVQRELDAAQKKGAALESRIESILREKSFFVDEVAETRRRIAEAKRGVDEERADRLKADAAMAALENLRKNEERLDLVQYEEGVGVLQEVQEAAEAEKRSLRSRISELRATCQVGVRIT